MRKPVGAVNQKKAVLNKERLRITEGVCMRDDPNDTQIAILTHELIQPFEGGNSSRGDIFINLGLVYGGNDTMVNGDTNNLGGRRRSQFLPDI